MEQFESYFAIVHCSHLARVNGVVSNNSNWVKSLLNLHKEALIDHGPNLLIERLFGLKLSFFRHVAVTKGCGSRYGVNHEFTDPYSIIMALCARGYCDAVHINVAVNAPLAACDALPEYSKLK